MCVFHRGECVFLIEKDKDICVCYMNKRAAEFQRLPENFPLSLSHHPAFNGLQNPTVLPLEMVGLVVVILRD